MKFKIKSDFTPTGDQPQAIEALVKGLNSDEKYQTLLGVTGSGKTFTIANVVERVQKPTRSWRTTKRLLHNFIQSLKICFPIMPLNTLFPITIIINPKLFYLQPAPILKKIFPSMRKLK